MVGGQFPRNLNWSTLSIETTVKVRSDMHCACTALEEELTLVEELTTHDSLSWMKVRLL